MIKTTKDLIVIVAALIAIVGFATVIMIKSGPDSLAAFSDFIILLVPAMLGGMWAANFRQTAKTDEIKEGVKQIHKRVNGQLDAKFDAINRRLDAAAVPRVDELPDGDNKWYETPGDAVYPPPNGDTLTGFPE